MDVKLVSQAPTKVYSSKPFKVVLHKIGSYIILLHTVTLVVAVRCKVLKCSEAFCIYFLLVFSVRSFSDKKTFPLTLQRVRGQLFLQRLCLCR